MSSNFSCESRIDSFHMTHLTTLIGFQILDSVTLKNLHLLENSCGGTVGTLLYKLDHCSTPMGKRYNLCCIFLTLKKKIPQSVFFATVAEFLFTHSPPLFTHPTSY